MKVVFGYILFNDIDIFLIVGCLDRGSAWILGVFRSSPLFPTQLLTANSRLFPAVGDVSNFAGLYYLIVSLQRSAMSIDFLRVINRVFMSFSVCAVKNAAPTGGTAD